MHKKFDHAVIEKKWQARWKESGMYNVGDRDSSKDKEYVLVEWPYPSGNLHIGHWFAFAVVDMYVRARRMQGKQVLFPIGFDAFGLPAENAAIKHGKDPKNWTEENIAYMTSQLESMGNAFSWDKTTSSIDPAYYKWTQWMFTEFYKNGIAYRGKGTVNWCPGCHTVIANEQVTSAGTCERSGDVIEKKEMPQWMLRITQFADALIDDLDSLSEWPEYVKEAQRQWIGRSKGAEIDFPLHFTKDPSANDNRGPNGEKAHITVFTTRADTLFGATYLVLSPEHPWVSLATDENHIVLENKEEVLAYIKEAKQKSEIERTNNSKEKTGVSIKGVHAVNPATGEAIPLYVADYVLAGYGTGAIMAVPAHDERDFAFAKRFDIHVKNVISPHVISTSGSYKRDESPNITEELIRIGKAIAAGEMVSTEPGILVNSDEFDGLDSTEAAEKIIKKVGGKFTNTYRLRDWSIGRQRYWGTPIPIVYDPEGNAHPIPQEHLPWLLPTDVDFTPSGEPPLAKSAELKERVETIFGKGWTPEVETMDTFVDSSWYYLRYLDAQNTESFSNKNAQNAWLPIDVYFGGSEHTTMHLLYSRFWHKALQSLGHVTSSEPYKKRVNRGLVLGPDGNKMSKSKGNVIDPDEWVTRLGADTVKMFLAFMGPYGEPSNYPWDVGGVVGLRRFLERVYGLAEHVSDTETEETKRLIHKTIAKVTSDIEIYKFNTAISALMVFINHAEKSGLTQHSYMIFLQLLAPFAPHLAEELWEELGERESVHIAKWPVVDTNLLTSDTVKISVQINGKMRGLIEVPKDSIEDVVMLAIFSDESLKSRLTGDAKRVIYVPNKIINIIL